MDLVGRANCLNNKAAAYYYEVGDFLFLGISLTCLATRRLAPLSASLPNERWGPCLKAESRDFDGTAIRCNFYSTYSSSEIRCASCVDDQLKLVRELLSRLNHIPHEFVARLLQSTV